MSELPIYYGSSDEDLVRIAMGSVAIVLVLIVAAGILFSKLKSPIPRILGPLGLVVAAAFFIVFGIVQPPIHQRIAELEYAIAIQGFAAEEHGVELSDEDTLEIVKANGPDFDREKLQELIDQKLQEYSSKG